MEFIDLSRYLKVDGSQILDYKALKQMEPVVFNHQLELVNEEGNLNYAKKLAEEGFKVVRIIRTPPLAKYLDRTSFPRRILFEMTSICNYSCKMCPQLNLKRPLMHMNGEIYRSIIDEIENYGVEGLWIYHFGESLLHPEFLNNIDHIKQKQNLGAIWLSTNGVYLDEHISKKLIDSSVDWLNFSLNAMTESTYNKVIPNGKYSKVTTNLERFIKLKNSENEILKPFLRLQIVEQEETIGEIQEFIEQYYNKVDLLSINILEHVNLPNNSFGHTNRTRKPLRSCNKVSRGDCFINSDGSVTICDESYNCEILLGNINDNSLYQIWNGEERKKILELNQAGRMAEIKFCQKCTDYDI